MQETKGDIGFTLAKINTWDRRNSPYMVAYQP